MDFYPIACRRQKSRLIAWAYGSLAKNSRKFYGKKVKAGLGQRNYELGCGRGEFLRQLAGEFPRRRFFGIDNSSRQIKAARSFKLVNLKFIQADVSDILPRQKVDLVFGQGILHHFEWEKLLEKMAGSGTRMVFCEPLNPWWMKMFRCLTPELRTKSEQPLKQAEIERICLKYRLEADYFIPGFKRLAWMVVLSGRL